jgi:hypothetical protein
MINNNKNNNNNNKNINVISQPFYFINKMYLLLYLIISIYFIYIITKFLSISKKKNNK